MKDITVTVFSEEQFEGDWPPENGIMFIRWFEEKLELMLLTHGQKLELKLVETQYCCDSLKQSESCFLDLSSAKR